MPGGWTCPIVRVLLEDGTPESWQLAQQLLGDPVGCGRHHGRCRIQDSPRTEPIRNTAKPRTAAGNRRIAKREEKMRNRLKHWFAAADGKDLTQPMNTPAYPTSAHTKASFQKPPKGADLLAD